MTMPVYHIDVRNIMLTKTHDCICQLYNNEVIVSSGRPTRHWAEDFS